MTSRRTLLASAMFAPMLAAPFGTATHAAQGAVTVEKDALYGNADGESLLLDVYRPPTRAQPRPAVIVVHGGAWSEGYGGRNGMIEAAGSLAEAGYVAFNIAYRLMDGKPDHNVWPAQLDDVQRAVRWVRDNAATYGVDPKRIASYGYSAGGHLAAMLGVRDTRDNSDPALAEHSSRVTCVVDLAGDMDLTLTYPSEDDDQLVQRLLGGTVDEVPEAYRDASPLAWVDAETVPFLVVHSGTDDISPVAHARTMVDALHEASVDAVYVELASGGHGVPAWWLMSGPWTLTFLAIHLRPDQ